MLVCWMDGMYDILTQAAKMAGFWCVVEFDLNRTPCRRWQQQQRTKSSSSSSLAAVGGKKKEETATTTTAMSRERPAVVTNSETLVGGNGRGGAAAAAAAIGSRSSSLAIAAAAAVNSTSRSSVSIANDNVTSSSSSSSNGRRSGSRLPPQSPLIESREEGGGGVSKKDKDSAAVAASSGASAAATTTATAAKTTTVRRSSKDISPVQILQNYYSNKTTTTATTTTTSSLMNIQYPEFYMCTRNEAIDRSNCHELHPLEYCHSRYSYTTTTKESTTSSSNSNNSRRFRPTYDSRYIVKKYRRSAAGGGTTSTSSSSSDDYIVTTTSSSSSSSTTTRTIDQLSYTVDYLLDIIFVNQYPPPYTSSSKSSSDDTTNALSPMSFSNVVSFIDDRLRAVQKELVTLLGTTTSSSSSSTPSSSQLISTSSSSSSSSRWSRTIDAKQKQQRGEAVDEGRRQKMAKLRRTVRHMQVKMIRYGLISTYLLSEVTTTTTTTSSLERQEKSRQKNSISSSSSYEYTFSIRALRAALTTYMSLCTCIHDDHNCYDSDDDISRVEYQREVRECVEVTSYVALLHLSGVIYNTEILGIIVRPSSTTTTTNMDVSSPLLSLMDDGGSGYNALLLQLQRQHQHNVVVPEKEMEVEEYYHPRLEWTLELACAAQEGNYQRYLSLLESGPTTTIIVTTTTTTTKMVEEEAVVVDQARFLILARCCISNSLNLIRLGQLRRYNFAHRKEERVSLLDIARLLHFTVCDDNNDTDDNNNNNNRGDEDYDDEEENDDDVYALQCAIDFCHYSGLPIVDAVIDMNDINQQETKKKKKKNCHVVMKSVPISVKGDNAIRMICRPGRMNDSFVFGTRLSDYKQPQQNWDGCSHGKEGVESLSNELVVMNLGDRAEVVTDQTTAAAATAGCFYARKDGDGILIPPSNVLRNLIS